MRTLEDVKIDFYAPKSSASFNDAMFYFQALSVTSNNQLQYILGSAVETHMKCSMV